MVVTSDICTSSPEGTGVCIFWDRAEPLFETTLTDVCCSGWSVFYGAGLWSSVSVSEHMCPLWALLLQIIGKGGSSVRQTSAQNKRWMIFLFCFVFMGHVAFPQQGVFDLMLELFFFFFHVTLLRVCFVRLKKNVGICNVWVMFFSKTGQFNDTCCQNIPVWIFDTTPSFFASVCLM